MSGNPFHYLFQSFENFSSSLQSNLCNFFSRSRQPSLCGQNSLFPVSSSNTNQSASSESTHVLLKGKPTGPVTKEDLGRATWTFLHTLAAQYPEKPTRQQKKDVKELMAILSRIYPCKDCADHFKEILRANPVQAGSHEEFSQWLCHVHNVVNRSLGKLVFPCERVDSRWGKLDCEQRTCDLQGTTMDDI